MTIRSCWTHCVFKNQKIVVDVTDNMMWFFKKRLLVGHERSDRLGMSMVDVGKCIRDFFESLLSAHLEPIVVYNGARLSEKTYGPSVSKRDHMAKSSQIRLYKMNRRGAQSLEDEIVPDIACNAIKQVINDLKLETHQSTYEVYPMLRDLANRYNCPVITSHSDFILANVERGFMMFEDLHYGAGMSELTCNRLYNHQAFLRCFRIPLQCSEAVYCLNVLLRPDFNGRHYRVINEIFKMRPNLKFLPDDTVFVHGRPGFRQNWLALLKQVLHNWPRELTDAGSVRRAFDQYATGLHSSSQKLIALREYDALLESFSLSSENISSLVSREFTQSVDLQVALTRRESTAPFVMDILMSQTIIDRNRIEDLGILRSTHSLADPVRLVLMNRSRQTGGLAIFDRQYNSMQNRTIRPASPTTAAGTPATNDIEAPDQMLYDAFSFPGQISSPPNLRAFIRESRQSANQLMKISLAFKEDSDRRGSSMCEQIIIVLLLVRFAARIGFQDNYDFPPPRSSSSRSPPPAQLAATKSAGNLQSAGSKSLSSLDKLKSDDSKYKTILPHYIRAVYNSIMYYSFKKGYLKDRLEEAELLRNDVDGGFFAKVSLAHEEIDGIFRRPADMSHRNYLQIKHLNEQLNSSLHAYVELNSLYNYPGPILSLADYYDCPLIYKICTNLMQSNRSNLLTIEPTDRLYSLLSDVLTDN